MQRLVFKAGRHMGGVSLLEALIALLLLSVGVLSMAATHAAAVRYSKLAQYKGLATQYANELIDRMRANRSAAMFGFYNRNDYDPEAEAEDVPECTDSAGCDGPTIAAIDSAEVFNDVRVGLPAGGYLVQQTGPDFNVLTVWMVWQEQEAVGSDADESTALLACPAAVGTDPAVRCIAVRVSI